MSITIDSVEAMKALGARLGAALRGGEIIDLVGDVGAGKTTFVKGVAAGLDIDEDIQSPSFTISRVYEARGGLWLAHYDFYRLPEPGIMQAEFEESMSDGETVTIIEWAGVIENVLPDDYLEISIVATSDNTRTLTLTAHGEKSQRLKKEIE